MDTIHLGIIMSTAIMAPLDFGIFSCSPSSCCSCFNAKEDMLSIGVPALRLISRCFLFAGVGVVLSSVFQALGDGMLSLWISVIRQLLLLLPAA